MDARRQRTAYLGPETSFSHQAAIEALPHNDAVPLPSFKAILEALQESGSGSENSYDYAVLPVENSTNGSVVQALDLLAQCGLNPDTSSFPDLEVVDEHYLQVHHCLFVSRAWAGQLLDKEELSRTQNTLTYETSKHDQQNGDFETNHPSDQAKTSGLEHILKKLDIKTLYTHPQVWGQCNNLLSAQLAPGRVERIDMSSTSAAAAYVAGLKLGSSAGIAAISSSLAGNKYSKELLCIASNIEDDPGVNTTHFLILQNPNKANKKTLSLYKSPDEGAQMKSLWSFTTAHHVPGSLATTLAVFATHGFNLSAIQSRPRPKDRSPDTENSILTKQRRQDRNWQYVFFVECLHSMALQNSGGVQSRPLDLLRDLKSVTEQVHLLGSWRSRLP